ncbi:MAG: YceD family protein [Curvibacter sp.]|jgi:uncharacterized protein|nr:DUF177 domain-containing protein [Curvibacter sp.]
MSSHFDPRRLDVLAFARAAAELSAVDTLSLYERLCAETGAAGADRPVRWRAVGRHDTDASGHSRVWLHLDADACLPLTCQRCLGPADIDVTVSREFRFAPTEEQAEAEDEMSEEDVLVLSRDFDLKGLVEDELIMALPLVPRHPECLENLKLSAQDPDFDASSSGQPHPFAALAGLKGGESG